MTLSRTAAGEEDPRKFAEERRLVLLLGSTSILFLVCVSPMVFLNVTLSEDNLSLYYYQVSPPQIFSIQNCKLSQVAFKIQNTRH